MESVILHSNKVWVSEREHDPDALFLDIALCDFSINENGVAIDRDHIDEWLATIIDEPIVGKILYTPAGDKDFSGHNAKIVVRHDENGVEYKHLEFDTSAFGTIIDARIENVEEAECIVVTAKIWTRFYDAAQIILSRVESGTLHTSWEIIIEQADQRTVDGRVARFIEAGRFIGHCLLGRHVAPAYPCSGVLSVAEKDGDDELVDAILSDLCAMADKEENMEINEIVEPVVEQLEEASLTDWDLRRKINDACKAKINNWCWVSFMFPEEHVVWCEYEGRASELDYLAFTYAVENDEVSVSEPTEVKLTVSVAEINDTIASLNEALAQANSKMEELNATIANLEPYRVAHEQAEAERIRKEHEEAVAELRKFVVDSKRFTEEEMESEEISSMIENLDKAGIHAIIADRLVAEMRDGQKAEFSAVEITEGVTVDLMAFQSETDYVKSVRDFLRA